MISKRSVKQQIMKGWERAGIFEDIRGLDGRYVILVKVRDCDRKKEYVLTMKKHGSTYSYVFLTNWRRQFMSEGDLRKVMRLVSNGAIFQIDFSSWFFLTLLIIPFIIWRGFKKFDGIWISWSSNLFSSLIFSILDFWFLILLVISYQPYF